MAEDVELSLVLNGWNVGGACWRVSLPWSSSEFKVASLCVDGVALPSDRWACASTKSPLVIKWLAAEKPPSTSPVAVLSFAQPRLTIWRSLKRINSLNGLLALATATLGAVFAYLGAANHDQLESLQKQVGEWQSAIAPLHCSERLDPQRAVTECIERYAQTVEALKLEQQKVLDCRVTRLSCP